MGKSNTQTINEIKDLLEKRENKPKPKATVQTKPSTEPPTEPSTEGLAEEVVLRLLQQLNKGSVQAPGPVAPAPGPVAGSVSEPGPVVEPGPVTQTGGSHTKLKEAETRFKMAEMMMKLSKNISILCILIFTLPFISVLVTMMGMEIAAMVISMIAMIYPALLFSQALGLQRYLSTQYGLKPLITIPQQQQIIPPQQNMIPKVPYEIHKQPKPQQRKQRQEFF